MMPAPPTILPIPVVRRAKKTKRCTDCGGRIPAGKLYLQYGLYRWAHLGGCPAQPVEAQS